MSETKPDPMKQRNGKCPLGHTPKMLAYGNGGAIYGCQYPDIEGSPDHITITWYGVESSAGAVAMQEWASIFGEQK